MKNTRFLLLLLALNFSLIGKAQMTTIYEFGNNTNDSIHGNFIFGFVAGIVGAPGGYWIDTVYSNGLGFNASVGVVGTTGNAKHVYIAHLPNMALYTDLEFQIEYTIFPSNQDLLLVTSNISGLANFPLANDNLVSSNFNSLAIIPYINTLGDSILKIQLPILQGPDSAFININYIKISADISTSTVCNASSSLIYTDNGNGNYSFTNTSVGNFNQSHWAFGDGNTSSTTNSNHTFIANGTFVIVLTVKDSITNCFDYFMDTLTVTGVPTPAQCTAGFVIYPDTTTGDVNVINSSTGNNLTYIWDFGDGNTSTLQNPSHTYSTAGPFYLCLTIDDGNGCMDMYCDSIGVNGVVFNKAGGFNINVVSPSAIGIEENKLSNLSIYPNPTTGNINIDLGEIKQDIKATLTNNLGQVILSENYSSTNIINLDINAQRGIYFLQLEVDGEIITKKIIKE
jgi:PKD repeat protein